MKRLLGAVFLSAVIHTNAMAAERISDQRLAASDQLALAQKALAICASRNAYVAVAIAGPDRVVRTLIAHDRANAVAIETARRKAMSAALIGYPTSGLTKAAVEAPSYVEMLRSIEPALVTIGGGVPIRSGEALLGGIGVGGASGGTADEACANEALAMIVPNGRP